MLLPSPLPSEPFLPPTPPMRPTLKSLGAFQPSRSPSSTLAASCRALQSILGSTPTLSCQHPKPSSHPRRRTEAACNTLSSYAHNAGPRNPSSLALRGPKKRRRDVYEADSDDEQIPSPSHDQENTFSTPKRPRRIPLSMPLGLCAADFHSLHDSSTHPPPPVALALNMPGSPLLRTDDTAADTESRWTPADDSVLVETVLEKLRLSRNEWNDCARILGKDKDSIGRRWKVLVGEGDVGLRRGGKRLGRTVLDIASW